MTSRNVDDQSAAAGCDAAGQLRETALPLPRGSEQSREEIATVIAAWAWPWCPYVHLPGNFQETALKVADQILALLSTAHAEGLGKEDEYGVQTHVEPQHCTGWRDIDSAPRHLRRGNLFYGPLIYALIPYSPQPQWTVAWWDKHYECFRHVGEDGPNDIQPTHWMPLPAPPPSELTDQQRGAPLEGDCIHCGGPLETGPWGFTDCPACNPNPASE